jgi:iron complex transport system permease protein
MTSAELGGREAKTAIPAPPPQSRLTLPRLLRTLATLLFVLAVVVVVATAIGSERIGAGEVSAILVAKLTGARATASPEHVTILWEIRLPRVLMAVVVGGGLSVAGAAYQALLRNPLADPYILGVSTGAAVGAIGATILASSLVVGRPAVAFTGAMITMAVVYILGQGGQGGANERLVLAGVIINALLSSVVIFLVTTAAGSRQRSVLSWLIGDLSGESRLLPLVTLLVLIGSLVVFLNARSLNLMMTGEEEAAALGVEVGRVKAVVYIAASLITGAVVAVSGVIGFVGLIIPHGVRMAGSSDNRLVVPASALAGGAFLLIADTVARTIIAPRELHIGVITALIGAPVFVFLLRRTS